MNIKAIILDVDGVIIGEKIGFNSPDPHPKVIQKLRELRQGGISVSLCTAKPCFAVTSIIDAAHLDNLHIADGGGVVMNSIRNQVVDQHPLDSVIAAQVVKILLANDIYTEIYTIDVYFIQLNQVSDITDKHRQILQKKPVTVKDLLARIDRLEITKIMPVALDKADKLRVAGVLKPFEDRLTLSWGIHPIALPLQFGIVTAPGISKKHGVLTISQHQGIPLANMLGVGDGTNDWQFIEPCGYAAAMGNASTDLKQLVLSKGEDNSYIGPGVDENGILKILDHYIKPKILIP